VAIVKLERWYPRLIGRKHESRAGSGCRGCDLGYCMPQRLQKVPNKGRVCLSGYTSESLTDN
jgi:hypothetical protein